MNSAIAEYSADPHRQLVTRFGLNLPKTIDYVRKGLDIALQAVVDLNKQGVPARLDTVGGAHEVPQETRQYVTMHGPLDKSAPSQLATFEAIQRSSHFLVFPTRADVYCMPAIETMAAGCVPVVSNIGDIPEIVADGETGICRGF